MVTYLVPRYKECRRDPTGWALPHASASPTTRAAEVASLRAAAEVLDALLTERSVDVDGVVEAFKSARRTPPHSRRGT